MVSSLSETKGLKKIRLCGKYSDRTCHAPVVEVHIGSQFLEKFWIWMKETLQHANKGLMYKNG